MKRLRELRMWCCTFALFVGVALCACGGVAELSTIKVGGKNVSDTGHIHIERDGKPLPASATMSLEIGDSIRTDANTTLVIRLGDARAVLMPNTKVSLGSIWTDFGRAYISGWLQGKSKLMSAAVKGTQYLLDVDQISGLTTIAVLEGAVQVSSNDGRFPAIDLKSAQLVRVSANQTGAPSIEPIGREHFNELIAATNLARDSGLDLLLVPDLTGISFAEAEAQLRSLGIAAAHSDVVAPSPEAIGQVVGQRPAPGVASRNVELQVGRPFKAGLDKVLLNAPARVSAGSDIAITWITPDGTKDRIVLVPPQTPDAEYYEDLAVSAKGGNGVLKAPAEPGKYELRYQTKVSSNLILARTPIEVTPARATLLVPNQVTAGSEFKAEWRGPNRKHDGVHLVPADTRDGRYYPGSDTNVSAADGAGSFRAPSEPGAYEVRYQLAGHVFSHHSIIGRAPLTVVAVEARLTVPLQCEAGASFEISWIGPNSAEDRIFVVQAGTPDYQYNADLILNARSGRGAMRAPTNPGEYEARYALSGIGKTIAAGAADRLAGVTVVARAPLTVIPANATITAPATAEAGSTIRVTWTGPNRPDDWLGIAPPDSEDGTSWRDESAWFYTKDGTGEVRVPATPGTYELRYVLGGPAIRKSEVIARTSIVVNPVVARITAPTTARAGTTVAFSWSGPKRNDDYIQLVPMGTDDGTYWDHQTLSAEPGRGSLTVPAKVGDYELRYALGGPKMRGSAIIARAKLRVTR
jgi:hypothetical protein